ncbi:MAG: Putative Mannose-1-phosphate guanylyltransferase (GDP) [Nitrospira sp.]|nr:MAG: Putative Mannose-1-phosphate guanylyltransferase (GDP) [Nitrospira sp.]
MNQEHPFSSHWTIVLAGGEGTRMQPLVYRWLGVKRPKQYCAFVGSRSMFQHTVDRAALVTDPRRIVAVVARDHREEILTQLEGRTVGQVIYQPRNCETAAGVFLPLTYIHARAPDATVVIFPSDHFVQPEDRFLMAVRRMCDVANRMPDRLILLGIRPDQPEMEYGWILPGEPLSSTGGEPVHRVDSFMEKPTLEQADHAFHHGALWNTFVFAARAGLLWKIGMRCFPDLMLRFEQLRRVIGQPQESDVLETIYDDMPTYNLSTTLLQQAAKSAAVIELHDVCWSDWGHPARVAETLRRIGRTPAFPLECLASPFAPEPLVGASPE